MRFPFRFLPATGLLAAAGLIATCPARAAAPASPVARPHVVDAFESAAPWSANPADGVKLSLRSDVGARGRALRLDFDFVKGGGYAVAHRALDLDLPENYAFRFKVRGQCRPNSLEFKLIDATGENVWWNVHRDMAFSPGWTTITIKKRQIGWAWGPRGGGEITHVAALEFAVTAGGGGAGSVWLDELELVPLPPPGAAPPAPVARASSAAPGHEAALAVDADTVSSWSPLIGDKRPTLTLDLGVDREFGGLTFVWAPGFGGMDYVIEGSADGRTYRALRRVIGGNGGRDDFALPESEARWLRVRVSKAGRPGAVALRQFIIRPLEWGATPEAFVQNVAREAPRGAYPRGLSGQQTFWTTVGVPDDTKEVLFSEDGALELGGGAGSVEPFLAFDRNFITWRDATITQSLLEQRLPVPGVEWRAGDINMGVSALGVGEAGKSSALCTYEVRNIGGDHRSVTLYLAVRPFQVNPPVQFLNRPGGTAPIAEITLRGDSLYVDGALRLASETPVEGFGALPYDGGSIITDYLALGKLPAAQRVKDPNRMASAVLAYRIELDPGERKAVVIRVPLHDGAPRLMRMDETVPLKDLVALGDYDGPDYLVPAALARARWREELSRVTLDLPGAGAAVAQSVQAQLAWTLISAAGPALQPGTRSYQRSWIRDGALSGSALLRLGQVTRVRAFIDWFAPHQFDNGKIPCVVDWRGSDPVPEHDSSGEFIFLIAEYYRYTHDAAFLARYYPQVVRAAAYLDSLRHERRTAEYQTPEMKPFFGLLPPSISHEGYSAKPMHSYWDDLWALRGFKDAEYLAGRLPAAAADVSRWRGVRQEFQADLANSIQATMAAHNIDFMPGCADLGDFDATSTTMALNPVQAQGAIPWAPVQRTFDKYWDFFEHRLTDTTWDAYTPYEVRNIGALVQLGQRDRANALVDFFLKDQKPTGWKQWPEVVTREERKPRFLGDLPHTWVATDFIRSALDMLAYDRESDSTTVLAAGVPAAWVQTAPGVRVAGLMTPYGRLDYSLKAIDGGVTLRIEATSGRPPGGFVLKPPLEAGLTKALVNGQPATRNADGDVVVSALPAEVRYTR